MTSNRTYKVKGRQMGCGQAYHCWACAGTFFLVVDEQIAEKYGQEKDERAVALANLIHTSNRS